MDLHHSPIPQHVAIIMDGNSRWARKHNLPIVAGHRTGAEAARRITRCAVELGIAYLTLYTFSSENWHRDPRWIQDLFGLLRWYLKHEVSSLKENGVKLRIIGDRSKFPKDLIDLMNFAEKETSSCCKICVLLALGYGGRDEIIGAVKQLVAEDRKNSINLETLDTSTFSSFLYTSNLPDPDLLIRTGGEQRVSNFLLWQIAYTEFVFSPRLWPDFNENDFREAIKTYQNRSRRYGGDSE